MLVSIIQSRWIWTIVSYPWHCIINTGCLSIISWQQCDYRIHRWATKLAQTKSHGTHSHLVARPWLWSWFSRLLAASLIYATTYGNSNHVLIPARNLQITGSFRSTSQADQDPSSLDGHGGAPQGECPQPSPWVIYPSRGPSLGKCSCHFRRWALIHPDHMVSRQLHFLKSWGRHFSLVIWNWSHFFALHVALYMYYLI